jgi:malate dehydrogenase (oxaloacetate-decarboxylating)
VRCDDRRGGGPRPGDKREVEHAVSLRDDALKLHRDYEGKIEVLSKVPLSERAHMNMAYSPGVAEPCMEIHADKEKVYEYTAKGNLVAVVSDGTAVLGLGDIGPEAGLPVMEGKAILFKCFAGVDAFPICVATKNVDEIVFIVKSLEPTFGGINLEDISAPRCFEVEQRLKRETNIPIFHDDQHGTAIVALAALINALKLVKKQFADITVAINGAGASGMSVANLLLDMGAGDVILCDTKGPIWDGRTEGMNSFKVEIARRTNKKKVKGALADAMRGADVFLGLSGPKLVSREMVASMAKDAIVLAMANPTPEIFPDEAKAAGAVVAGTGRSDLPNQVNNVLAFPGVFRGALDVRASDINEPMKIAAAKAIADLIKPEELRPDYVIVGALDRRAAPAVAAAVAKAAMDSGIARAPKDPAWVAEHCRQLVEKTYAKMAK